MPFVWSSWAKACQAALVLVGAVGEDDDLSLRPRVRVEVALHRLAVGGRLEREGLAAACAGARCTMATGAAG